MSQQVLSLSLSKWELATLSRKHLMTLTLNVNGKDYPINVLDPEMPLLWAIRDLVGLTGTKYGCGIEICEACTVLVDGEAKKSCDMDVTSAVGRKITTIEGLSPAGTQSNPVQQAWIKNQVPQCGYCQSGMILKCEAARRKGKHGTAILGELKNLCVCGTYQRIREAVTTL
jgi:isoquinoline 1-oxidoreductase alpha subunit